jgi:hypothetical protein
LLHSVNVCLTFRRIGRVIACFGKGGNADRPVISHPIAGGPLEGEEPSDPGDQKVTPSPYNSSI